jgi:hypothetical protein
MGDIHIMHHYAFALLLIRSSSELHAKELLRYYSLLPS